MGRGEAPVDPMADDEWCAPADARPANFNNSSAPGKPISIAAPKLVLRLELEGPSEIFAPLPPMRWVSRDLMIGPGRPALWAAYGASGKTLSAQSMLLSLAAGRRVWERFEAGAAKRCIHLDYEQGKRDTYRRYQRLALGHAIDSTDIGDRLHVATMPSVYLTSETAYEELARLAESADLVLFDSLRAAMPGVDENASEVRQYLDMLTRVSEATGAAFLGLHHAGKARDGHSDSRQVARGSSAIFDAAGSVLNITAGKSGRDPKRVEMTKSPASSEGAPIDAFDLVIDDVQLGDDCTAGVRVLWRPIETTDAETVAQKRDAEDRDKVLAAIKAAPGASQDAVCYASHINKQRARGVLAVLEHEGRIRVVNGAKNAKAYWPVVQS